MRVWQLSHGAKSDGAMDEMAAMFQKRLDDDKETEKLHKVSHVHATHLVYMYICMYVYMHACIYIHTSIHSKHFVTPLRFQHALVCSLQLVETM